MTADESRELALSLPETVESAHMDHPDFRVGGKIFATLGPKEAWGMVKMTRSSSARNRRRFSRSRANESNVAARWISCRHANSRRCTISHDG
jgi:predicted DNA-binding protein (MmcQ/YjbR family)